MFFYANIMFKDLYYYLLHKTRLRCVKVNAAETTQQTWAEHGEIQTDEA